jgi:hypothetical protein
MPKRSGKKTAKKPRATGKRPKKIEEPDANQTAFAALKAVLDVTEGTEKDPIAVMLGRRGGLKGGRARADKMSKEARRESARKAARARWNKSREGDSNP